MAFVDVSVYEVKYKNKVVLYWAARESSKLVQVNMVFYIGPDPLD